MKHKFYSGIIALFISCYCFSQDEFGSSLIKDMSWGTDFEIKLKLENDSVKLYNVQDLHHTKATKATEFNNFTYYPVNLSNDFIKQLKENEIKVKLDTTMPDSIRDNPVVSSESTLWSAIHGYIGGGWIHFVNTLLYTLEKGYIDLKSPLMKRPETSWKPRPMTESYKRTKKWEYYAPTDQRLAIKEFNIRERKDHLNDLNYLPERFINTFMETSQADYERMVKKNKVEQVARIDLIRLLLGSNYLSRMQINYIKNMVLKAVSEYSMSRLPSVIIFDNMNAAVAMSLDDKGYHVEKIIFKNKEKFTDAQLKMRRKTIVDIVDRINEVNKDMFQKKLAKHYR
jgi:uncharacterized protein YlaI